MQEDKEPVFDAVESLSLCLAAMTGMIGDLTVNEQAMAEAAGAGFAIATDLADWLVRETGLPFRQAHHVAGRAVALAESRQCRLEDLSLKDLQGLNPDFDRRVFSVLSPAKSAASRKSYGGTAPANVRAQIKAWRRRLAGASIVSNGRNGK